MALKDHTSMSTPEQIHHDDEGNGTEPEEPDSRATEKFLADVRSARVLRKAMDRLLGREYTMLLDALDSILEMGFEHYLRTSDESGREKLEELLHALDSVFATCTMDIDPIIERADALRVPDGKEEQASVSSLEFLKNSGSKMRVRINGSPLELSAGLVPVMVALMAAGQEAGADMVPFKPASVIERELGVDPKKVQYWVNRLKTKLGEPLRTAVESRRGETQMEYRLRIPASVARRFLLGLPPARKPE